MKVDPTDGTLLWAKAYASRWGMNLEHVEIAHEGLIFAAGAAGRVVSQDRPVNLFAKFDSDGALLDHVTVGPDPDWPEERPGGGNTPYDIVSGLVWTEGRLLACGTTGLGDDRAGWVMRLTEELGVEFFSIFDGPKAEIFLDLADTGDGIAILGSTRSAYPWATGGQGTSLLQMLPREGMMRFHEDSGMTSFFAQPQVHHTSASFEFQMLSTGDNPGAPQTFSNAFSSVAFQQMPLSFTPGGAVADPVDATAPILLAIEKIEIAVVDDYDDWTAYHNLHGGAADPFADDDDDGVVNVMEAFLGRSPWIAEEDPIMMISAGEIDGQPVLVFTFNRARYSPSLGVVFQSSAQLDSWLEATGLTEEVQPLDAVTEQVRLIAPRDLPAKFFRFATAAAR
jgi:hypothetical protein